MKSKKSILLAGGRGSRLLPLTTVATKQLLPVYDKPLIYYPLSTLLLSGSTEILVISDPASLGSFEKLLGSGDGLGVSIQFQVQEKPRGIAEALILGEEFIGEDDVTLMLGDNILYGAGLGTDLAKKRDVPGAKIFANWTKNPENFGVVEFDPAGNVVSIEEKPEEPQSNYAIPGLYFYDNKAVEIAKGLHPSVRGELEISDVNRKYLEMGELEVSVLPRGTAWMDTGTIESLADATEFVRAVERRQGLKVGCPEEVAWRLGLIDDNQLEKLAKPLMKSGYGEYLMSLLESK